MSKNNLPLNSLGSTHFPLERIGERNELYPIFLKLHQLNVLIVGGGNVGLEKLSFMLKSSPNANEVCDSLI